MVEAAQLLKDTVRRVVVGQGNRFVKELLRERGLPIGATKADFLANLMQAIDDGNLNAGDIEAWLGEVEGWGNQHIYFWSPPDLPPAEIEGAIRKSPHAALLRANGGLEFPEQLQLTAIDLQHDYISFGWHRGNDRWIHVGTKDFRKEEDGDLWEYRAFRQRSNRTVVRFEWRFDRPYCNIMLQLPKDGTLHEDCISTVWQVVKECGLVDTPPGSVALSRSVNAFSAEKAGIKASERRMLVEGGHVDVVSTVPDVGIAQIEALRSVDGAIDPAKFNSADGRFKLQAETHDHVSRDLGFEVSGAQGRVRIGVQCLREDVRYLNDLVWDRNVAR